MSGDSFPSDVSIRSHFHESVRGLRWRIVLSILGTVAWIGFTLLYIAFWAHDFSLFQSVVVVVVSLLVLFGVTLAAWVSYGLRAARRWTEW
ncbi:MAG: hypothetical protein WB778_06025 [Thermoplasmata archaeon]|jgi:hypothetical protein